MQRSLIAFKASRAGAKACKVAYDLNNNVLIKPIFLSPIINLGKLSRSSVKRAQQCGCRAAAVLTIAAKAAG